jgi:DNA (cytosine-5)-methyltransferase 1
MRYLSVCSGMEAASVAWHPLGWRPVGFSEIEPFPCAILKHRFLNVPNYGSLTEYQSWPLQSGSIDLLVGGTPCQSFSVAGLRKGLADPRGNLALTFLGLADKLKPRWIVWENVPGVLSSGGGRDFGSFLGALVELGYGFAYRVLDAQHFGVPQRRRRVFVVACLGDWRAAAEVLSLREGLRGYLETGNKKRKSPTADAGASVEAGGLIGGIDYEHNAHGPNDVTGPLLKGSPTGGGHPLPAIAFRKSKRACSTTDNETWVPADASNTLNNFDLGDTRTTHAVVQPVGFSMREDATNGTFDVKQVDTSLCLQALRPAVSSHHAQNIVVQPVAWTQNQREEVRLLGDKVGAIALPGTHQTNYIAEPKVYENHAQDSRVTGPLEVAPTVAAKFGTGGGNVPLVGAMAVRRLTPVECERLQGFPDNWSRISWKGKPEAECPDGPRYKACGNSMAVPVMRWIGERISTYNSQL